MKPLQRVFGKHDPRYGRGQYSIDLDDCDVADPEDLKRRLLAIFEAPTYKPPVLPEVALELTELSKQPNLAFSEVTRVLERDPMIAAEVLRVAQSPLYSSRVRVSSLSDALNRLGITGLRDIVWQIALGRRLFRVRGYTPIMQRLQQHSVCVAYFGRLIAGHAGVAADQAFLCGLLHDVGVCGTLIALVEDRQGDEPPALGPLWDPIDRMHADAGAQMANLWSLSAELSTAIARHHAEHPIKGPGAQLAAVLCVAEALAIELDRGLLHEGKAAEHPAVDSQPQPRVERALEVLGLSSRIGAIRGQCTRMIKDLG